MGGISIWQLVIVLVIVLLIFGTKKFRNMGSDLGSAVKGFKSAMGDAEQKATQNSEQKTAEHLDNKSADSAPIDVNVTKKEESKKDV